MSFFFLLYFSSPLLLVSQNVFCLDHLRHSINTVKYSIAGWWKKEIQIGLKCLTSIGFNVWHELPPNLSSCRNCYLNSFKNTINKLQVNGVKKLSEEQCSKLKKKVKTISQLNIMWQLNLDPVWNKPTVTRYFWDNWNKLNMAWVLHDTKELLSIYDVW